MMLRHANQVIKWISTCWILKNNLLESRNNYVQVSLYILKLLFRLHSPSFFVHMKTRTTSNTVSRNNFRVHRVLQIAFISSMERQCCIMLKSVHHGPEVRQHAKCCEYCSSGSCIPSLVIYLPKGRRPNNIYVTRRKKVFSVGPIRSLWLC